MSAPSGKLDVREELVSVIRPAPDILLLSSSTMDAWPATSPLAAKVMPSELPASPSGRPRIWPYAGPMPVTSVPSSNRTLPFNLVTLSGLLGYFPLKWKKRLAVLIEGLREKSARAGARRKPRVSGIRDATKLPRLRRGNVLSG